MHGQFALFSLITVSLLFLVILVIGPVILFIMTTLSTMANKGALACIHNFLAHLLVIQMYYNNQMVLWVRHKLELQCKCF